MGHKPLTKMSQQDRAKQFMPFAALKGLPEALRRKERLSVERKSFMLLVIRMTKRFHRLR